MTQKILNTHYLLAFFLLFISLSGYSQNWHVVKLGNLGSIELPCVKQVIDTANYQIITCSNDSLIFRITNTDASDQMDLQRSMNKKEVDQMVEEYIRANHGQQISRSDIEINAVKGTEIQYVILDIQEHYGNLRYARLFFLNGHFLFIEIHTTPQLRKLTERTRNRVFQSIRLIGIPAVESHGIEDMSLNQLVGKIAYIGTKIAFWGGLIWLCIYLFRKW